MLNKQEVLLNILPRITCVAISIGLILQLSFASYCKSDIYDLWNTMDEFEEVSSLRKFLIDKGWISESVRLDELDYILVLTQQCSSEFFPNVPTSLVLAIICVESGFRADMVGFSNDTGLMQVIPKYHKNRIEKYIYGEKVDLFDPRLNVMVGMDYLSDLLTEFDGDIPIALTAYNMGPDRARKYSNENKTSVYAKVVLNCMNKISIFLEGR